MTHHALDRPVLRLLPPVDELPPEPGPDPLRAVARGARAWGRRPVDLPRPVTVLLWSLLGASALVGGWLAAVARGAAACSGPVCGVATLGGHAPLLAVLAAAAVLGLTGSAFATRGLTEADGPALTVILASALAGGVAVVGVLAVVALALFALAIAVTLLARLVDLS